MILYIILAVVVIIVLWAIVSYNGFVTLTQRVKEAWSDIDVQLKRRYDLIPNLVETVKGYAAHESGTLEKVTEMRTRAMNATAPADKAEAENMLSGALKSLFAVSENYPNLKANENFLELQRQLEDTENKLQAARRFYNGVVMDLNTRLQHFPGNVIGSTFGFKPADFFQLGVEEQAAAQQPVKVQF
ncbi:MAG TPA: LemA family protein [Candidatus Paceibacterota bacterium]|nr:LemA family protein [Candidatus Paceibacterota bacterium]